MTENKKVRFIFKHNIQAHIQALKHTRAKQFAVQKTLDMINKRPIAFLYFILCTTNLYSKNNNFIDLSQRNCAIKKIE